MNKKTPQTTSLLVWEYFDELINNLDIYTEKSFEKIAKNEEQELRSFYLATWKSDHWIRTKDNLVFESCKKRRKKHYYYPYRYNEYIKFEDETRNEILATIPENPTQIEYFNGIRFEAIRRMKLLRDELIEKVKRTPTLAKCNPSQLTPEELEDLCTQVFADSIFCFQIDLSINSMEFHENRFDFVISPQRNPSPQLKQLDRQFEMITVFTDFYLSNEQVSDFSNRVVYGPANLQFIRYSLLHNYVKCKLKDFRRGDEIIYVNEKQLFADAIRFKLKLDLSRIHEEINLDFKFASLKSLSIDCNEEYFESRKQNFLGFKNVLESLKFLKMRNFCFKDPTVFDNLPNLLSLELYLCSNQTSNKRLLDNLTKLEQLTIDIDNEQPIDLIIPSNVKHLYLIFDKLTKNEVDFLFSNVNLINIISLRIDCRDSHNEDDNLNTMNLFASLGSLCTKLEIGKARTPWSSFSHLTNLTIFKCVDWDGMVDFDAFKPLVNLKTLDLTACNIQGLPANIFVNQKQLETLILEENSLKDLNCEAFNGFESLKVLNVRSNDLSDFDLVKLNGILSKLTCLEVFYISELEIEDYNLILDKLNELKIRV